MNRKLRIRVDDVRLRMEPHELDFLDSISRSDWAEVFLCVTPLWLDASGLGSPQNYEQTNEISEPCNETISRLRALSNRNNVVMGIHGLFHFYLDERKADARHLLPEWKHINFACAVRDFSIAKGLIRKYFDTAVMHLSPPSNILSRDGWKAAKVEGLKVIGPRFNLVNDLLVGFAVRFKIALRCINYLNITIYFPLYSEKALQVLRRFIERCGDQPPNIVILVHPWELEEEQCLELLTVLQVYDGS